MYIDGVWKEEKEAKRILENMGSLGGWASQTGKMFRPVKEVSSKLPPDVYSLERNDDGDYFKRQTFPTDDVIRLPDLPCDFILDQIKSFWTKADLYAKHGLLHKRGVLLYGVPGGGKTSIIRMLCNDIIKIGGVVFSITDFEIVESFVSKFREIEPNTPIMTLMEDIEGLFEGEGGPVQVKNALSFLDGQAQTSNIVHVATTNQPEKVADRFIKRPGRFDLVIGIDPPTYNARFAYLKHTFKSLPDATLVDIATKTDGMAISYLREIVAASLLDISIEESIKRLKVNSKTTVFQNKRGYSIGYEASPDEKSS